MTYNDYFESPLGLIEYKASDAGIRQLIFCGDNIKPVKRNELTKECHTQLTAYFNGDLKKFDLPLDFNGTDFQQRVWQILLEIPFGQTLSYMDIANRLNNPKAVRAVGGANGRNPITLIVPCHRVIGASKTLTGYAGGTARKRWLLSHEGIELAPDKNETQLDEVISSRQAKTQFLD
ncbi:methylated-DNA--protein-cysteine methyltransferase [Thalassotalea insulae]|uniref:Methylated-DNA--protein-cysteine methyltransferase n=1 Tax=Thalassotalea insulae TaxID=2056778 RepID=A0ABQ6GVK9_9GAMM|nr:methylated-DNA--[protein]-cysteine S-methyltransferase [Thalassotalea insulae]GLX78677.1 methylated-DNA--protein-cysteine methyltransferase [Thalassotalea insulae]